MDFEDPDPVVQEIDLFNCSGVNNQGFLLQFPLVNRDSSVPAVQYFDHNAENDSYELVIFPETQDMSDLKITLTTQKVNISQPMALGVLKGNELHLTPIHQIMQAKPIQQAREEFDKNYDFGWTRIQDLDEFYSDSRDDISASTSVQLYQKTISGNTQNINLNMIESLDPEQLQTRPPREQLIYILIKDKTISFDEQLIKHNLKANTEELLSILPEYAYFIQGRWTIKPEKIPENIFPAELRLARNFLIALFAHKQFLPTNKLNDFYRVFDISREHMAKVAEGIGIKQDGGTKICFKYKENLKFQTNYPECTRRGLDDIESLQETICIAKHDPKIFEKVLQ